MVQPARTRLRQSVAFRNPTTVDSFLELMDYAIGIALGLIVSGWAALGKELWRTAN
jgi:hypothetical protein